MIGIYGGTFDPVHYGHLRTALEVKEALNLSEVRFVPARLPPHRAPPVASPEARREMLELALAGAPMGFALDLRELERPGPSYMVDTLVSLRRELGAVPVCLLLGMDAFLGLPAWHRWQEIFQLAHLVVMARPGFKPEFSPVLTRELDRRRVENCARLRETISGAIYFQPVTLLGISSTFIRSALADGRSPKYLLPDRVLALICQRGYYQHTNR